MPKHEKRVALVTGGNRGIGYAIGRSLAQRGITVILGVRDPGKGATACSRLQGEDLDVNFELLDVTDEDSLQTAVKHIQAPLTPEQGADTPVWLATLSDGGPTGGFYRERTRIPW
jgi:NAD(P)-dependent dehydrogenase (short-subunit alcohol dehydrogenase family)